MDDLRISVDDDTAAWLKAQAASLTGGAVGRLIEQLVTERRAIEDDVARDDHLWAKPAIDAGLASLERGDGSPLADVIARANARAALRAKP